LRQQLRRLHRRFRIHKRLLQVIRLHRISKNPLARMKRICSRLWRRINRRRLRHRLRARLRNLQQRQILNRSRPRKLKIFEPSNFFRFHRALRKRHRQKRHMPQERRNNRPPRPPRLDPAILKKPTAQKSLSAATRHQRAHAAPYALMKIPPGKIEPRSIRPSRQARSDQRHRRGCLPQQIQRPIGRTQTHSVATKPSESSLPLSGPLDPTRLRDAHPHGQPAIGCLHPHPRRLAAFGCRTLVIFKGAG
jgi:hypothetical protein